MLRDFENWIELAGLARGSVIGNVSAES